MKELTFAKRMAKQVRDQKLMEVMKDALARERERESVCVGACVYVVAATNRLQIETNLYRHGLQIETNVYYK